MEIVEILNAEQKSSACADIIKTLPAWFGIPEANERYIKEAADKDVFAAYDDRRRPIGMIALRYHFQTTAEIWWMGVRPDYHRRGIGKALVEAAKSRAKKNGCRTLAVMTLSPRKPDLNYARTRAFYERQGFRLLLEVDGGDPKNPLAWMTMELNAPPRPAASPAGDT
ncbi:MAG TPA: GNAT family N-acetyltransferase [Stellaceae bacterium]|nr:GNAT family N-acetyltransferase [Stellaceae bacterium]